MKIAPSLMTQRLATRWRSRPLPVRIGSVLLPLIAMLVVALLLRPNVMPHDQQRQVRGADPARAVASQPVPAPPSPELLPIGRDAARALNAGVPLVTERLLPASPFILRADGPDRERAIDCLAAAMYYEAGDDATGEAAVAQVVLNRVRHPAFPKTVCGVVFQGAERATGCQFTFTCDGALARYRPSAAAWKRARDVAVAALDGKVHRAVGLATHYHTDWVVPYWSSTLDKVAAVGTHLFFRWRGYWGTPRAFSRRAEPVEPTIERLSHLSPDHVGGTVPVLDLSDIAVLDTGIADAASPVAPPAAVRPVPGKPSVFLVTLERELADRYASIALEACGEMRNCRFLVWTDGTTGSRSLPLTREQLASAAFSYVRDRNSGFERLTWNCQQFAGRTPCTPATASPGKAGAAGPGPVPSQDTPPPAPKAATGQQGSRLSDARIYQA